MGCDIHLYVEIKNEEEWLYTPGDTYDPGRNYNLFAILAGVRNNWPKEGYEFIPISEPKGLPNDVSLEVQKESDSWHGDAHNHSWLTLKELLDYDWTQTTILQGMVSSYEFFRWTFFDTLGEKGGEAPESYSGGVGGGGISIITRKEMEEKIEKLSLKIPKKPHFDKFLPLQKLVEENLNKYYCQVEWKQPYYKCARSFWSDIIPQLLQLNIPENVRIVFWFDN